MLIWFYVLNMIRFPCFLCFNLPHVLFFLKPLVILWKPSCLLCFGAPVWSLPKTPHLSDQFHHTVKDNGRKHRSLMASIKKSNCASSTRRATRPTLTAAAVIGCFWKTIGGDGSGLWKDRMGMTWLVDFLVFLRYHARKLVAPSLLSPSQTGSI